MINILFCGNDKVFDGMITTTLSILKRTKTLEPFTFYIFTMNVAHLNPKYEELHDDEAAFLNQIVKEYNPSNKVVKIDVKDIYMNEFSGCPNEGCYCSPYTLLRLFADIIQEIPDKILYLDVDVMFNRDIKLLYDIDIEKYEYAAARDHYGKYLINPNYINAGVLLLNMKSIRESGLFRRAVAACAKKKIFLPDQTALNRLVKKKLLLPAKYNEQKHFRDDTVIQHFSKTILWLPYFHTRNIKPWQTEAVQTVLTKKYDDILEEYKKMKLIYEKELHRGEIPIFFACDDNYLPYLAVALKSLILHADNKRKYHIYVLCDSVNAEMAAKITAMATENVKAEFVSVTEKMASIIGKIRLRDYYTPSILPHFHRENVSRI